MEISCNVTVQALASQGNEIALDDALFSTSTANLLIVSPLFRGSNPYPCGSLTYRVFNMYSVKRHLSFVNLFRRES